MLLSREIDTLEIIVRELLQCVEAVAGSVGCGWSVGPLLFRRQRRRLADTQRSVAVYHISPATLLGGGDIRIR